ncbi:2-oxoglutarate dehydrogenase E1 component [Anaplasma marginale]|uniref:2-oxoglutarate dehydrogenase E1 component n=1 Tax=Anaplasma marginale TaxID=770 RepID=UPI000E58EDE9|nr:2-oxoglutarate dehydrogenase E1 component [Anaplasma marginale]AXW84836.1 2-oxoglutarate dehydrogenase E1 component [Anaplasma marginale]
MLALNDRESMLEWSRFSTLCEDFCCCVKVYVVSYRSQKDCLFGDNALLVEEVYSRYERGDAELPNCWKSLFTRALEDKYPAECAQATSGNDIAVDPKVLCLLHFFRSYGHLAADLDPLGMAGKVALDHDKFIASIIGDGEAAWRGSGSSLPSILQALKETYCGSIGYEFMHIPSSEERDWLRDKIENTSRVIAPERKRETLRCLQETELFEQFLHVRYPGYKRFSVEGGDVLVPLLERIIALAPGFNCKEVVLGLSHRGRLSVLTRVMRKPYAAVLYEFSGGMAYPEGLSLSGDVKYHLGYSTDTKIGGETVHLSLAYNSSSLESVNPVVMGRVKAKSDEKRQPVLGILVHGNAAFIGQGVVSEGFTLSGVAGYSPGGIVHVVVNNQVGFTADPESSMTSFYCSDVAKMIDAPVFHVNGDDPESVLLVADLAMEYRSKFGKDVVVDIVCYRRFGHNEGDEPMFTQPLMYKRIAAHKTVASLYAERLISEGVVTKEDVDKSRGEFRAVLEEAFAASAKYKPEKEDWFQGCWQGLRRPDPGNFQDYLSETGVERSKLLALVDSLCAIPEGFNAETKIARMLAGRLKGVQSDSIDWGTGEALAIASLLVEKFRVRLSGEDSARGTFSHRHARLVDQVTGEHYVPLNNLGVEQARFDVMDSPLSEYAVMGFEYGYSLDSPNVLVIWEAQFGDFANGAQIIIDQYVSAAETKWMRSSGLVLLLPHGYEGQGPEHSSARIERYLQLCAEDNMQVVNCTTPANFFHALRRQLHRDFRKPLVVFTPKSLLRHKMAVSKISDFEGHFIPVIGEVSDVNSSAVRRVVVCSGKVYYDLLAARADKTDVALLRLEQYYPFPTELLANELAKYKKASVVWCQEEHFNMGGWSFVRDRIEESMRCAGISGSVSYIGRSESASTAAGYPSAHATQQQAIIDSVFA